MFKPKKENRELYDVIKAVQTTESLEMPLKMKNRIKERMLYKIKGAELNPQQLSEQLIFSDLVEAVRKVASQVVPSCEFKFLLRKKIQKQLFSENYQRINLWDWMWRKKALVSGFILGSLLLSLIVPIGLEPRVTFASQRSYLKVEFGEVNIKRDGKLITPGGEEFVLEEGDLIQTGQGRAIAYFFDDSITRLDENTELGVNTLFYDRFQANKTLVDLSLNTGRIWAKVVRLLSDYSSFNISAEGDTYVQANKKAVFVISTTERATNIKTVDNVIDLHFKKTPQEILKTTLGKGYEVEVKREINKSQEVSAEGQEAEKPMIVAVNVTQTITDNPIDNWEEVNLIKDVAYDQEVEEKNKKEVENKAGLLSDSPLYSVKTLSEQADLTLTFNGIEKEKKRMQLALKRLAEVGAAISQGKEDLTAKHLEEFKVTMAAFFEAMKALKNYQGDEAINLLAEARSYFLDLKRLFVTVLPDSPLYEVKKMIRQMEVALAPDTIEEIKIKGQQASDELLEIQELASKGNTLLAIERIKQFALFNSDFVQNFIKVEETIKEEIAVEFLNRKIDELALIEVMENEIDDDVFYNQINSLRQETVIIGNKVLANLLADQKRKEVFLKRIEKNRAAKVQERILLELKKYFSPLLVQKIEEMKVILNREGLVVVSKLEGEVQVDNLPHPFVVVPATANVELDTKPHESQDQANDSN